MRYHIPKPWQTWTERMETGVVQANGEDPQFGRHSLFSPRVCQTNWKMAQVGHTNSLLSLWRAMTTTLDADVLGA